MTPTHDDLLTGLRSAQPDPEYQPSSHSADARAMLAGILDDRPAPARSRRRVTRRRLVLAGIPVVAAAVAVTGFMSATGTPSGSAGGQLSTRSVGVAMLDALQQHSGDVLQVLSIRRGAPRGAVVVSRDWVYPAFPAAGQQVRHRSFEQDNGRPYQDIESVYTQTADMERPILKTNQGPRSAKVIGVDYQSRTWARFTDDLFPASVAFSPALIRSEIASGGFTVDGKVKLNGREAVKVGFVDKVTNYHVTIWVDAHSYVLLRSVWFDPTPGFDDTTTYTYEMRPATSASLKLLDPVIPAGFTKVARLSPAEGF